MNHQNLDKQDVELLGELIDIVKDVEIIYDYQDKMDMGYSQMNGSSYMRGRSGRMMPYNRGSSYGRNGGYSRNDNKEAMLDHLQDVMDMAVDEKDRKAISRLISQMEQQN